MRGRDLEWQSLFLLPPPNCESGRDLPVSGIVLLLGLVLQAESSASGSRIDHSCAVVFQGGIPEQILHRLWVPVHPVHLHYRHLGLREKGLLSSQRADVLCALMSQLAYAVFFLHEQLSLASFFLPLVPCV